MEIIEDFLTEKKEAGLLRVLMPISARKGIKIMLGNNEYMDFSSNDYLGLSDHPKLIAAGREALEKFGAAASASRLMSGDLEIHHKLEEEVARFKAKEAALVFNSGYQANISIISAFYGEGDCIFSDRLNHASIVDGISLAQTRFFRFRHNDTEHLETLLKKERHKFKDALIVTETIFSMDGDKPSLKALVLLKEKYNCEIMVDEAHATGIFGRNGGGIAEAEGLEKEIDFVMGTFSKALGGFGGYLAASRKRVDFLINVSRGFIYSTALPPSVIACNLTALDIIKEEPWRRQVLLENAEYLRSALKDKGFFIKGDSQIIPLIVGKTSSAIRLAQRLKEKGFWVQPIRPPTVPAKEARLRFSLSFNHSREILSKLIDAVSEIRI